jgi:hypothetical protein
MVTHRHHPLEGKQLQVLCGGRSHLTVRLRDSSTMRIERAWTDADGPGVCRERPMATQLTVDAVRDLLALVNALKQGS